MNTVVTGDGFFVYDISFSLIFVPIFCYTVHMVNTWVGAHRIYHLFMVLQKLTRPPGFLLYFLFNWAATSTCAIVYDLYAFKCMYFQS